MPLVPRMRADQGDQDRAAPDRNMVNKGRAMNTANALRAVAVLLMCLSAVQVAEAKILKKRTIAGSALLLGGAVIYSTIQKGCHPVKDPDSGRTTIVCTRSKISDNRTDKSGSTAQLKKALNAERKSAGLPPDPDNCDAHHIVPKSEGRRWAKEFADVSRAVIEDCVDMDSSENGVFLPGKSAGAECEGTYHKSIHTKVYYERLAQRLEQARDINSCEGVRAELRQIKQSLMEGRAP